jgi:hypothetical protein
LEQPRHATPLGNGVFVTWFSRRAFGRDDRDKF